MSGKDNSQRPKPTSGSTTQRSLMPFGQQDHKPSVPVRKGPDSNSQGGKKPDTGSGTKRGKD